MNRATTSIAQFMLKEPGKNTGKHMIPCTHEPSKLDQESLDSMNVEAFLFRTEAPPQGKFRGFGSGLLLVVVELLRNLVHRKVNLLRCVRLEEKLHVRFLHSAVALLVVTRLASRSCVHPVARSAAT